MSLKNRYIGIENEFQTFAKGKTKQENFKHYFENFKKTTDYSKSPTSIRTDDGIGYYVDGWELELLTPPVALNKGFSTRLTDLLMIGRDRIIEHRNDIDHTGYSMHWNVTKLTKEPNPHFYQDIAVPFHLFGLTPLSGGLNVRQKFHNMKRYEILGDSLIEEDQINATALLLGAHSYAVDSGEKFPLTIINWKGKPEKFKFNKAKDLFLPDGRYSTLKIIKDYNPTEILTQDLDIPFYTVTDQKLQNMQAQQYLELFYQWLNPYVKALGTKEEIQNLEGFITGEKQLEFDKFKYFAYIQDVGGKSSGMYKPTDSEKPNQTLKHSGKKREVPLEGKLLGEIVKKKKPYIESFEWSFITLKEPSKKYTDDQEEKITSITGIDEIYKYANTLNPQLPKFKGSKLKGELRRKPNPLPSEIKLDEPLEYKLENDNSLGLHKQGMLSTTYHYIRSLNSWDVMKYLMIAGGTMLFSMCTSGIINSRDTTTQIQKTIKKYHMEQMKTERDQKELEKLEGTYQWPEE